MLVNAGPRGRRIKFTKFSLPIPTMNTNIDAFKNLATALLPCIHLRNKCMFSCFFALRPTFCHRYIFGVFSRNEVYETGKVPYFLI